MLWQRAIFSAGLCSLRQHCAVNGIKVGKIIRGLRFPQFAVRQPPSHSPSHLYSGSITIFLIYNLCFSIICDYWYIQRFLLLQFNPHCFIYALYYQFIRNIFFSLHTLPLAYYIYYSTFPTDISKQSLYKCRLRAYPIGHFTFYAGCDIC